jgi:predicted NUDIX family NTP pyrophosphohydrolase
MGKTTAGILLYRYTDGVPEFFLVHPGGPFWIRKDVGAWSVPKGELNEDEDVLLGAKREFEEETSIKVDGKFIALKAVKGSNGKTIRIFALQHDIDPSLVKSNLFSLEWPAKSGKFREFPEVDRGGWFSFEDAVVKINKHQLPVLQELRERLDSPT